MFCPYENWSKSFLLARWHHWGDFWAPVPWDPITTSLKNIYTHHYIYCCSVTKPCLTLCDPWTVAHQTLMPSTISQSWLKFTSTVLVILSNHLIPCHPLLLLPSIFPSIRVFSNELALCIRWPKYWSFSFTINPFY